MAFCEKRGYSYLFWGVPRIRMTLFLGYVFGASLLGEMPGSLLGTCTLSINMAP